jgi:type II secretory pathway pseudopilin PulG
MKILQIRAGLTFIELILFMAIAGIMSGTVIPMLISATESRQRQDAIALVEQNGEQILQTIMSQTRSAQRIIYPATGSSSTILALKTESGATNPTIFALTDGAVVMIQGRRKSILSSPLVGVTSFAVDNTSVNDDRQSVAITYNVRRVIRLFRPLTYDALFNSIINVNPDDILVEDDCNCTIPFCDSSGSGQFIWSTCDEGQCIPRSAFSCVDTD